MYVNILYYSRGECPVFDRLVTDKINSNLRTLFVCFSVDLCTSSSETRENPVALPGEINRS